MNVGQVEFEVRASGLDDVLNKARTLQDVLNGINGKAFFVNIGQAAQTIEKAGKMTTEQARAFNAETNRQYKYAQATAKIMDSTTKKETAAAEEGIKAAKTEADIRLKEAKTESDIAAQTMKAEDNHYKTYHEQARKDQAAADKHEGFLGEQRRKDEAEADVHMRTVNQESRDAVAALDKHMKTVNAEHRADVKSNDDHRKAQQDYEKGQRKILNDQRAADNKDMLDKLKALKLTQSIQQAQISPQEQMQRQMETDLVRFGSRMQTLGATLQRVTSPFMNVYRGLVMGAGYRMLGTFTNSIEGAFRRFDIMKMYPKMMKEYNTKNFTAEMSKTMLDKSVRGLPTGLGEIMEMAQRYTLSLGDMRRGTRLAIASNRAFLASMATDTQRYQGMLQLQDLMNGKKLQPREWMSLGASMGKAINEIAKVMGAETQEDIRKFREQLYAGEIDGEKFLDALEKVGNKGGEIYKKANAYKNTIEALQRNINNAFERMGEKALTALDDMAKALTGKGLVANLKGITKWIDELSESAQKWIKANPDKIMEFFDMLKSIDWAGVLTGFAQMGGYLAKFYGGFLKVFGGSDIVKMMINLNMLGKGLQIFGGLTKGLAGPISKLLTGMFLGGLGNKATSTSNIGKNLRNITGATKYMSKTVLAMKKVELANKGLNILGFLSIAASVKLAASAMKDLSDVNIDFVRFGQNMVEMAGAIGEFAVLAQLLSPKGAITGALAFTRFIGELELGAIATDLYLMSKALNAVAGIKVPKKGKLKKVLNAISDFAEALPEKNPIEAIGNFFASKSVQSTAKAASSVAEAINSVNKIKGSLKKFRKVMFGDNNPHQGGKGGGAWGNDNSIVGIMEDMLTEFDNNELLKTITENWKSSNIAAVFDSLASMMEDFTTIATTKMGKKRIDKAVKNIEGLSTAISPLIDAFMGLYNTEFGDSKGAGRTQKEKQGARAHNKAISSTYGAQAQGFAKMMEYLAQTMGSVSQIVTKLNKMKKSLKKLNKNYGGEEGLDLTPISTVMESMTKMFDETGVASGDYSLAPDNMSFIDEAMDSLKSVIKKINGIKKLLAKGGEEGEEGAPSTDIGKEIGIMVSDLIAACSQAPMLESYILVLDGVFKKLKGALDNLNSTSGDFGAKAAEIQSGIQILNSIGTQVITFSITIDGEITGQDEVLADAEAAINAIKLGLARLQGFFIKPVTVYISGSVSGGDWIVEAVRRRIQAIKDKIAEINGSITKNLGVHLGGGGAGGHAWPHTGGLINANGKIQYRALGGVMRPRGTDTVPAMLTPGEYVVRRAAVNTIGVSTLQKLNHLDIRGALYELSARVARNTIPSRSIINNTTNNTKNINVGINNRAGAGVGLGRANRWVTQL